MSSYQKEKTSFISRHGEVAWREKERAKKLAYCERHPLKTLLIDAKKRAKQKNLDFTIDVNNPGIQIPEFCPVLNIPLFTKRDGTPGGGPNSPSIDRIDNTKGYVPGNIIVVSNRANSLKKDASLNELIQVVNFYGELQRAQHQSLPQPDDRAAKCEERGTHSRYSAPRPRLKNIDELKNTRLKNSGGGRPHH